MEVRDWPSALLPLLHVRMRMRMMIIRNIWEHIFYFASRFLISTINLPFFIFGSHEVFQYLDNFPRSICSAHVFFNIYDNLIHIISDPLINRLFCPSSLVLHEPGCKEEQDEKVAKKEGLLLVTSTEGIKNLGKAAPTKGVGWCTPNWKRGKSMSASAFSLLLNPDVPQPKVYQFSKPQSPLL